MYCQFVSGLLILELYSLGKWLKLIFYKVALYQGLVRELFSVSLVPDKDGFYFTIYDLIHWLLKKLMSHYPEIRLRIDQFMTLWETSRCCRYVLAVAFTRIIVYLIAVFRRISLSTTVNWYYIITGNSILLNTVTVLSCILWFSATNFPHISELMVFKAFQIVVEVSVKISAQSCELKNKYMLLYMFLRNCSTFFDK